MRYYRALWCASVFCLTAFYAQADTTFSASLTGAADGATTSGTGFAWVDVNSSMTQISYTLSFQGLTSDATMSHIHYGAAGTNGPILLWFFPSTLMPTPTATSGSYSGMWTESDLMKQSTDPAITTFATLIGDLEAGNTYVNIHSTNYPMGELRGQLMMTPEPGALALVGLSLILVAGGIARRRKTKPRLS